MALRGISWLPAGLAAGAVAACATQPGAGAGRGGDAPGRPGQQACFYVRQVQEFTVLDRSSLVVYAPSRRHAYRLAISPPAPELRLADGLGFDSRSGQICGRAGDTLLLGAGPVRSYPIVDVRRLEPGQLDSLLGNYRKAGTGAAPEPAGDVATAIEPVENGADE